MSDKKAAPPKPNEVLGEIYFPGESAKPQQAEEESKYIQRVESQAARREAEWVHLQGLRDHYRQKGYWSWFLILLLVAMIGFQSYLLREVGLGRWDFTKYEWLLPILLVQNLGQIISLAVIVVKSLFR